jgi:biopolymer transport protein ExbB
MNVWLMGQAGGARQMGIDFFDLLVRGGIFMVPIALMSLVVVTFLFDRWIGLRRGKLIPGRIANLLRGATKLGSLDPSEVYRLCRGNSALERVVQSAVLRAGRPHSEIQASVSEAIQREVDRSYANVRWLNLGAGIAPLLGLLGTVWGLIRAFHDTTRLIAGENRADFLAVGIYEALVTTLAGLMVAIPAAVASHYFEGRIQRIFRDIEELSSDLVRGLDSLEGRVRTELTGKELSVVPTEPSSAGYSRTIPPPVYADKQG